MTGSTSGVGRSAALALGRLGVDVVVHGRKREKSEATVEKPESIGSDAQLVSADFTEVEEVSHLADTVRESADELDVLCNNAGGLFDPSEETSLDVERNFHVNHLSPYLLTADLLTVLGSGARVITTASIGHRLATLELDNLAAVAEFSDWSAYCQSKLANVRFSNELARRLAAVGPDVTASSLHPGVVPGSEFTRALSEPMPTIGRLVGEVPVTDSVEDGAATIVYLAASDEVEGVTGGYFSRCSERRPSADETDVDAQRKLWERSADLLDIEEPLPDAVGEA